MQTEVENCKLKHSAPNIGDRKRPNEYVNL